jgi:peptide/nickel transport system permease protein
MIAYVTRRFMMMIPTLFGVATIVFFIVRLIPGDPARVMAGDSATEEQVTRIRQGLGLDQPLPLQYARYLSNLARGNLGRSISTGDSVVRDIWLRLPYTVELALVSTALGIGFGVTAGIVASLRHKTPIDFLASVLSVFGLSMPSYWLGMMLIIMFAVNLRWFPASGANSPQSIILPSITLAAFSSALIARMSRSSMLGVLRQNYIRTARAKGVARWSIVTKHAFRNALLPIITIIGLQFGSLLGGAVLTETVFSWPGIGRLLVDSIFARDYPMVQGIILVFSVGFMLVNLLVDLAYSVIDPRIAYR